MPKKIIEQDIYDPEPELEENPIKISKRTGKPVRPMSEKQKETLKKGREIAIEKKKALNAGVDLERKAKMIKEARDIRQQEKLAKQKKMYEDAIKDDADDEEELVKPEKKEKKKKKIVKYIEESSSDSEEEEIIYKKKKKNREKTTNELEENVAKNELKKRLENVRSNSLSQMLMPSYY